MNRARLRLSCACVGALNVSISDGALVCARCLGPLVAEVGEASLYSQLTGERPPGCGRVRYLRIWRRARDAGDAGASVDGRARLLTRECYARHASVRHVAPKPKPAAPVDDALAAIDAALGIEEAS